MKARTALSVSQLPGLEYALNPYSGCSHACIYCYAQDVLRMDDGREWGSFAQAKVGLPNILAKELKRKEKGMIGLGTVTDPYQVSEERSKNTRYCLEQIARKKWPVCVQTKSDLVKRDIDVLARIEGAEVGITITTLDEELASELEPGAPTPAMRLEALRELVQAGIRTWVFIGPIIPTMNDSEEGLAELLVEIANIGVGEIQYDRLRLKPVLVKRMRAHLGERMNEIERLSNDTTWFRNVSSFIDKHCEDLDIVPKKAF